jgi:hypothetical protein
MANTRIAFLGKKTASIRLNAAARVVRPKIAAPRQKVVEEAADAVPMTSIPFSMTF